MSNVDNQDVHSSERHQSVYTCGYTVNTDHIAPFGEQLKL